LAIEDFLKPLSEPISKLIDAVRDACGAIYEPTGIRRKARAEGDALLIRADAEARAALVRQHGEHAVQELELRASHRINVQELRRQQNIEAIVTGAARYLPPSVSKEPVDEDWIYQFFNHCQDIGDAEMQSLWARLLAGEIAQPGRFSIRTLSLVRTLHKSDVQLFTQFCGYIWDDSYMTVHLHTEATDSLLKAKGIPYIAFLHLQSLGLLELGTGLGVTIDEKRPKQIAYYGKLHTFSPVGGGKRRLAAYTLTDIGCELAPIAGAHPDQEYLDCLISSLNAIGIAVHCPVSFEQSMAE
jgi:uncharacterized repeat protein (TIGR03899 family)